MAELPLLTLILAWFFQHITIGTFMFVMSMDLVTGLLASAKERKLISSVATNGWIKKCGILLAVVFAFGMEPFVLANMGPYYVGELVTLGFIGAECISIIENLGRAGVVMPVWFKSMFVKFANASRDDLARKAPDKVE